VLVRRPVASVPSIRPVTSGAGPEVVAALPERRRRTAGCRRSRPGVSSGEGGLTLRAVWQRFLSPDAEGQGYRKTSPSNDDRRRGHSDGWSRHGVASANVATANRTLGRLLENGWTRWKPAEHGHFASNGESSARLILGRHVRSTLSKSITVSISTTGTQRGPVRVLEELTHSQAPVGHPETHRDPQLHRTPLLLAERRMAKGQARTRQVTRGTRVRRYSAEDRCTTVVHTSPAGLTLPSPISAHRAAEPSKRLLPRRRTATSDTPNRASRRGATSPSSLR